MEYLLERQRIYDEAAKRLWGHARSGYGAGIHNDWSNDDGTVCWRLDFPDVLTAASWARMVKDNWGIEADLADAVESMWRRVTLVAVVSFRAAEVIVKGGKLGKMEVSAAELKRGDILLRSSGEDVRHLLITDVELRQPHEFGLDTIRYLTADQFEDTAEGREKALNDPDSRRKSYSRAIDTKTADLWPIERN